MKNNIYVMAVMFLFLEIISLTSVLALSATVSVPQKYQGVHAGEQIFFETEIKWPENTMRKDLRIEYFVRDNEEMKLLI
ncbi:hypothetical protein J4456_04685 [Candidatus Pacearchaeota archaeon]|nr:hypothetical protein [Candidatus Pacearchaeota archaeon]